MRDPFGIKSASTQANEVEAEEMGAVAAGERERNDVALDAGQTADKSAGANPHKLMHGGSAADHAGVINLDMTAKQHLIGQDHAITETTIMRDMRAGEKDAVVADLRSGANAGIDRHMLARHAACADFKIALRKRRLEILRWTADDGERKNNAAGADPCSPGDDDMRMQSRTGADLDMRTDITEGTDDDIRAQTGAILDNRGWMYRRGHCGAIASLG